MADTPFVMTRAIYKLR